MGSRKYVTFRWDAECEGSGGGGGGGGGSASSAVVAVCRVAHCQPHSKDEFLLARLLPVSGRSTGT